MMVFILWHLKRLVCVINRNLVENYIHKTCDGVEN